MHIIYIQKIYKNFVVSSVTADGLVTLGICMDRFWIPIIQRLSTWGIHSLTPLDMWPNLTAYSVKHNLGMRVLSFSYGIVLRQIPLDFTDGKWNMVQLSSVQFFWLFHTKCRHSKQLTRTVLSSDFLGLKIIKSDCFYCLPPEFGGNWHGNM